MKDNVVSWLRRNADKVEIFGDGHFVGVYGGRKIRYNNITYQHKIEIGDGDFDRWANSVGVIFTLNPRENIMLQINRGLYKAKSIKECCTYKEIEV